MKPSSRKREVVLADNGLPFQVIRPANPSLALKLADDSLKNQDTTLLDRLPGIVEDAAGSYTFLGYLARRASGDPCVIDSDGTFVCELAPGDSFVTGLTNDSVVHAPAKP